MMFFRIKQSGARAYVQVVENKRVDGSVRQSVIANVGRADALIASGALASLLLGFRTVPLPLHRGQAISPLPMHRAQTKQRHSPRPLQVGHWISFSP
jgi:hypothetical protein